MNTQGLLTGLFIALYSSIAFGQGFDQNYEAFVGDYNSDGYDDIYIRQQRKILILHGDIATPILIPVSDNPVDDFVLVTNIGTEKSSIVDATNISLSGWQPVPLKLTAGDFDMDGNNDLIVSGMSTVVSGYDDQIIFANPSSPSGTPSLTTRIDTELRKFITNLSGYFRDPVNYLNDPNFVTTTYHSEWQWNCEGNWYYDWDESGWDYEVDCYWDLHEWESTAWNPDYINWHARTVMGAYEQFSLIDGSNVIRSIVPQTFYAEKLDEFFSYKIYGDITDGNILAGVLVNGGLRAIESALEISLGVDADLHRGTLILYVSDEMDRAISPPCKTPPTFTWPGECRTLTEIEKAFVLTQGFYPAWINSIRVWNDVHPSASDPENFCCGQASLPFDLYLGPIWREEFYLGADIDKRGTFLHEAFHIYQFQHYGITRTEEVIAKKTEAMWPGYSDKPNYCYVRIGVPQIPLNLDFWGGHNVEQQAAMIQDRYRLIQDENPVDRYPPVNSGLGGLCNSDTIYNETTRTARLGELNAIIPFQALN